MDHEANDLIHEAYESASDKGADAAINFADGNINEVADIMSKMWEEVQDYNDDQQREMLAIFKESFDETYRQSMQ